MARPAPARTLQKRFSYGGCVNFRIWPFCARDRTIQKRRRKKGPQKANTRSEQRTRKGPDQTFKNPHFWEPQALRNRPQGSPKRPRKRLEAAGSQSQRQFAAKNIPGTPAKPSESLRRAMRLSPGAPRGLRVTGFAHPGPLGTDNYQRKAINNNSTRDLTRRWAAGPANSPALRVS